MKDCDSTVFIVLGFSTSINVGENVSTSYPPITAFPGDILYTAKLSEGVPPLEVNWFSEKIPLFPKLSFKEFKMDTSNGDT